MKTKLGVMVFALEIKRMGNADESAWSPGFFFAFNFKDGSSETNYPSDILYNNMHGIITRF